jgi:hypothetical protein
VIDWKRRALELAEVVDRYRRDRMHNDRLLAWNMAQELIELGKREDKARKKFFEWNSCTDKKQAEKLYDEYLELIRL